MKNLKNQIMAIYIGLICPILTFSQNQPPTNNNPAGNPSGFSSQQYWSRAGNNSNNGTNNIFGTLYNSPIYTTTNNTLRMKLNGTLGGLTQYTINGFTFAGGVNTSGYLLLGENNNTPMGNPLFSSKGAFSLLHLNGPGSFVQEGGYRPWMKTGVFMNEQSNNM